jgi:hypothetical protein
MRVRDLRGMTEESDPAPGPQKMAICSALRDRTASAIRVRDERSDRLESRRSIAPESTTKDAD